MASCREMNPDGSYALAVFFAPGGRPGWDMRLNTVSHGNMVREESIGGTTAEPRPHGEKLASGDCTGTWEGVRQ